MSITMLRSGIPDGLCWVGDGLSSSGGSEYYFNYLALLGDFLIYKPHQKDPEHNSRNIVNGLPEAVKKLLNEINSLHYPCRNWPIPYYAYPHLSTWEKLREFEPEPSESGNHTVEVKVERWTFVLFDRGMKSVIQSAFFSITIVQPPTPFSSMPYTFLF